MKIITLTLATVLTFTSFCSSAFEKIFLISPDQVDDVSFKDGGLTVNNFSFSEKSSFMAKGLVNVAVSLSAKNGTEKPINLSIMTVGLSGGEPLWSISAEPMMSMLSPNKTDSITQDVYASPETLKKTDKIWIKITGSSK